MFKMYSVVFFIAFSETTRYFSFALWKWVNRHLKLVKLLM